MLYYFVRTRVATRHFPQGGPPYLPRYSHVMQHDKIYSLCKELFAQRVNTTSRARRQCAVHPIVLVSVSAEDRAIDHQNRPRRSSTVALDVLSPRRSSDPSVHVAMRMVAFSWAAQLHSVDQCRHGITWHLLGCCTCTRCTSCCPKICALRAR